MSNAKPAKARATTARRLRVKFKGKSIADVLDMNVEEAQEFFKAVPSIREKMDALMRVGLGYIKVGQQATTLSGGEAQRVKLSKELAKRSTGRTLYILDEPTTGLHFEDVRKLLEVLQELVEGGNTVIVIEHNLDVVKTADWIIDIGPEGGDGGGTVVAKRHARTGGQSKRKLHRALPQGHAETQARRGRSNRGAAGPIGLYFPQTPLIWFSMLLGMKPSTPKSVPQHHGCGPCQTLQSTPVCQSGSWSAFPPWDGCCARSSSAIRIISTISSSPFARFGFWRS